MVREYRLFRFCYQLFFLLLLLISTPSKAETFETEGFVFYTISDGTGGVGSKEGGYSGDVIIPEKVTNPSTGLTYTIIHIGAGTFRNCKSLTSVKIPNTVSYVDYEAFQNCTSLTSIEAPGNMELNWGVFDGCDHISKLKLNGEIVGSTFSRIASITEVELDQNTKTIGNSAFIGCTGITSIIVPNSVTTIGDNAFEGCSSMTSFSFPASLKIIGSSAFQDCTGLTSITIPTDVTNINNYAFEGCTGLQSIEIMGNLTYISHGVFSGCTNLSKLIMNCNPGYSCFSGLSSLKEVTLGSKVSIIASSAFSDCTGLASIDLPNSVKEIGSSAFQGCSGLTYIKIPNSVTRIDDYAFEGCTGLLSVELNGEFYYESHGVFSGCTNLSKLTVNSNYVYSWFSGLTSLKEVDFGSHVVAIGSSAFKECTGLSYINIPNNVKEIGSYAFEGCINLSKLTINNNHIGSWFSGLTSIKEVTIGDKVSIIGLSAFKDCTGLASINISDNVEEIGSQAFEGCTGITSLSLPASLKTIGSSAFKGCINLMQIVFPKGVSNIEYYAFEGCPKLATMVFDCSTIERWFDYDMTATTEIILQENVDSIANGAFERFSLKTIKVLGERRPSIRSEVFKNGSLDEVSLIVTKENIYDFINDKEWGRFAKVYSEVDGTLFVPVFNVYDAEGLRFDGATYSDSNIALYPKGTPTIPVVSTKKGRYIYDGEIIYHTPGQSITYTISDFHKLNRFYFCPDDNVLKVTISPAGSLLDKIGIDNVKSIKWLKLSGEMNGTDVMVLRRMDNLEHLDLEDVRIVEGGMAYYDKITTANDRITGHFLDGLTKLKSIVIPGNVSVIDKDAFRNMASCECIVLGEFLYPMNGLSSIGEYAFAGCSNLNVVRTPFGLKDIGWSAFEGCNNIQRLVVRGNVNSLSLGNWKQPVKELYLERDVANCTFNRNKNLSKVILAGNITKITDQMFAYCTVLNQMRMSDKVNTIENQAFQGCTGLTTLALNKKLASIGASAFSGCNNLTVIVSANPTPPDIQSTTFDEMTEKSATLYVPVDSKTAYWLHQYWGNFFNIVETDDFETPMIVESITAQHKSNRVYNLSGQLVKVLNEQDTLDQVLPAGIYIVGGKKVIVK